MGHIIVMIGKRLAFGLLTIIVISIMIFLGVEALPGDTAEAILGHDATPEAVEAIRKELKLDLPPHIRYFSWLNNLFHGDLGNSLANQRPIIELIRDRFFNTIFLAATAAVIAVPFAVILGMLAALYRNSWLDNFISMSALTAISFPEFFTAYILIAVFSVHFNIFPSMSSLNDSMSFLDKIYSIILPCVSLVAVSTAHMMRMTRASIINLLGSAFIEMARLKGFKPGRIIIRYALPNAISPIINVVVLNLAWLIAGVVIVEVVFVYPGLGQLLVDSVSKRDIPVVQASGLVFACTYVLMNLVADILSTISNPKLLYPIR